MIAQLNGKEDVPEDIAQMLLERLPSTSFTASAGLETMQGETRPHAHGRSMNRCNTANEPSFLSAISTIYQMLAKAPKVSKASPPALTANTIAANPKSCYPSSIPVGTNPG